MKAPRARTCGLLGRSANSSRARWGAVMKRLASVFVLLIACGGCRMCSDCCDYSSCVADAPYAGCSGRAGSVLAGGYYPTSPYTSMAQPSKEPAAEGAPATDLTPVPETH